MDSHSSTAPAKSGFGTLLKHWRGLRRMSQLDLAGEANLSARHLCFLETGRARPSREMVRQLGAALDVPLADRNAMALAAGYAPQFGQRELGAADLDHVRRALDFILRQQEPYPGLVIDGRWDIRMGNAATTRIFGLFRDAYEMDAALAGNAMHVVFHPGGLRRFIVNWEEFAGGMIDMLHREAGIGDGSPAGRLRAEILAYSGIPARWHAPADMAPAPPVLAMTLRKDDLALSFFTTLTTFALPRDAALQQLRIEGFYPADDATEAFARKLAAGAATRP